jgi:hypothetical protein
MAERFFKKEVQKLYLGAGQEFRGEGILAVTKALLQSGASYVAGYQGAPISHLMDVLTDRWLEQVKDTAQADYALALEVAECPRLVKGYGDTYVLGSRNFESLMRALPSLRKMKNAAARLKALRETALADDTGKKLENALAELNLLPGGNL